MITKISLLNNMAKHKTILLSACCNAYTKEVKALCGFCHKCIECGEICNTYKPNSKELELANSKKYAK